MSWPLPSPQVPAVAQSGLDLESVAVPRAPELLGQVAHREGEPVPGPLLGVHGLVHLLGCDHEAGRAAAREMLRLEQRACRVAGLPPPRRPYGA